MKRFAMSKAMATITAIYCSSERKARECAVILGDHRSLTFTEVRELGEIDRSATGYLPPDQLEVVIDEFYSRPLDSVYGRERAADAQTRIVCAVQRIAKEDRSPGDIALVSHGGVGCLLVAHLVAAPISRVFQQISPYGGCYFSIEGCARTLFEGWRCFEDTC